MEQLYDTCGLVVQKLEGANGIQPFVIEHTTSTCCENTVKVALIVCVTVFLISLISAITICLLRGMNRKKPETEKGNTSPKDNVGNKEKAKKDYTTKLMEFLEDLSKNKENSRVKDISDPACKTYIEVLTHLAKNGNLDNYNQTNVE